MTFDMRSLAERLASVDADRIAIDADGELITRRELSQEALAIAAALRRADLSPGAVVAVEDFSSWRWIAAMLGVWAAGGVYMPLDGITLTAADPVPEVRLGSGRQGLEGTCDRRSGPADPPGYTHPDLGYLLPTSGSTGAPKWVRGSLAGLSNFIAWEIAALAVSPSDVVSQLTPASFDPVFRDVLLPLLSGARLAMTEKRAQIVTGPDLAAWLQARGVTIAHMVPTVARAMEHWAPAERPPNTRAVLLAGEPLHVGDIERLFERFPRCQLIVNLYGPSETTLAAFAEMVSRDAIPKRDAGSVPVGHPLPGVTALVLNEDDAPCLPYERGEVVIRSRSASHGYWPGPLIDGERFIVNPFDRNDAVPVYRTKDIGFELPDGRLVLEGRLDAQYKFRGSRVDLGQLEATIRTDAAVRDVGARVVSPPGGGVDVLAVYVDAEEPVDRVRERWAGWAGPAPSLWLQVDALPRTRSGKLNRAALPLPLLGAAAATSTAAGPILGEILRLWQTVMPYASGVTASTSFSRSGGQSIEAVQLLNALERRFGLRLSLRAILDLQTPEAIAEHLERAGATMLGDDATRADAPAGTTAPLTGAQQRFWDWTLQDGDPTRFQFLFAAELSGPLDASRLSQSLGTTIASADGQRMAFRTEGATVLQSPEDIRIDVPIVEPPSGLTDPMAWCEADALQLAREPFSLRSGGLARARIYRLAAERHVFALVNHVLASDGWTKERLLREVSSRYDGHTPSPARSFLSFARQQELERADLWPRFDGFWAPKFASLADPALPYAGCRRGHAMATIARSWAGDDHRELVRRAGILNISLPSVLLAALLRALHAWTGQSRGHLLLSNASRPSPDLNSVLGCFTDSLLFTYDESLRSSPSESAERTQTQLADCLSAAAPGFLWLTRRFRPDMDPHAPESFPIIFAPQPDFLSALTLPGVQVAPLNWGEPRWIWPLEVYPVLREDQIELRVNHGTAFFNPPKVVELMELILAELRAFNNTALGGTRCSPTKS